jgi:hypothetical protein
MFCKDSNLIIWSILTWLILIIRDHRDLNVDVSARTCCWQDLQCCPQRMCFRWKVWTCVLARCGLIVQRWRPPTPNLGPVKLSDFWCQVMVIHGDPTLDHRYHWYIQISHSCRFLKTCWRHAAQAEDTLKTCWKHLNGRHWSEAMLLMEQLLDWG